MIEAYANSTITIMDAFTKPDIASRLCQALQWPNPDFDKKAQMGKSTWQTPRNIVLWQQRGYDLIVPFGMLQTLRGMGIEVVPAIHLKAPIRTFNGEVDNLYSYQKEALERALKARNGVLVAPCGSGKTQIGLAICASLGCRTLWLTHTHELLKQSMDRAKRYLDDIPMGTITNGKVDVSNGITFATVQTMAMIDLSPFQCFWDVIIVDECHKCVGTPTRITMFWKVLSGLCARYKIGLTATPKRGDGMERAMYALLGPKFYEIERDQVKDTTVPLHIPDPVHTNWNPDLDKVLNPDGTLNYVSLITECINDEARNEVIAKVVNESAEKGPVLVLSERVAHLSKLADMCNYPSGNLSSARKSDRRDLMAQIRNGEIRVLFATYAIAKEGLDIPCLRYLIIASPIKDEIAVTQSAGRVMRKWEGKEYGTLCDFDDDMGMLKGWLKKRMAIYRKINRGE